MRYVEQKIECRALDGHVIAVAKLGAIGDWAAYIGAVAGKNFDAEAEEVAYKGTKLPRKLAEVIFPDWRVYAWRD